MTPQKTGDLVTANRHQRRAAGAQARQPSKVIKLAPELELAEARLSDDEIANQVKEHCEALARLMTAGRARKLEINFNIGLQSEGAANFVIQKLTFTKSVV